MATLYYVEYSAIGSEEVRKVKAGPYESYALAESHRKDIAGYESIVGAKVTIVTEDVHENFKAPEPKGQWDRLLESE